MSGNLVTGPDELHRMLLGAFEVVDWYYGTLPDMRISPATTAREVRDLLDEPLPQNATSQEEVLKTVRDVIFPLCRHNGHPRFFGYVSSPGSAAALMGDLMTSALNANVTSWRSAPAAAELELVVIDWFKNLIGYDSSSAGLLVSGGSIANLCGLAAARAAADPRIAQQGARGRTAPLRIYTSEETHFSIQKAARILGIGSENVRSISTDQHLRIDVDELESQIEADRKAGFEPMCIVGNAGTVNTGAVDSIASLADVAKREHLWLHVDGAYGAFAGLSSSSGRLFAGIERADSVSLDPHKWLYTSTGCGCILYRDPHAAKAAFAEQAEYTRPVGLSRDEAFAFWDFGPELSRPFRALTVWLQFKMYGARALAAAIERNIACARYFESLVENAENFEMLAPVTLSIFCFRFRPPNYSGDLDALNERILVEVQRRGSSYLSNARVRGEFALRGCVLNYRTTNADMERLLEDVREAAKSVLGS